MGRSYSFVVPITPVGKQRSRTCEKNGKRWAYTPEKTETAEAAIREAFLDYWNKPVTYYPLFGDKVPVRLIVLAVSERPKSCHKKRIMPVVSPDADNIIKTVGDALNGWAWDDDSQITSMMVFKRYGSPARLEITLSEDTEEVTNG